MSRVIEGEALRGIAHIVEGARAEASSSTCSKDHRGAVVFRDRQVLGMATNGPIYPHGCNPATCFDVCGLFTMHAERQALVNALADGQDLNGASVLHVRINENEEVQVSGKLRCEDCTGYMARFLRKGILLKEFILLQEGGWTAYEISEADEVTRRNIGLT
ncbi:MAG: hypothetical protein A2186_03060 [Candidatus Levybacteria bacterium RIFOXYA1_FULL_41_10]|nr:MAG: hypothetical protein UT46_C0007G0003 [Candidatus Levybacteria bacterium GW2011_GWA1_39_34]KKR71284.1 MAG: hypothetical protein UU15_C0055G0002 [Candidatus Levybacteria bacterium GW2011_GWC2_40_7]OGH21160.1 MAG: hypothetical protein A2695_00345 [Candidatus Levybacteria bacterium RIFCSPHIGHO2_01_FULL_40_83]OGH27423.1 MAG: hypothetical protein A3D82_01885 [Candidatus Levybacteria bacterium RIFCSPHIGHO2_02_FULL_40_29]OGH30360.1 MAG: hypothetical protein A3E70_03855 [Candidatus Levybacteria 